MSFGKMNTRIDIMQTTVSKDGEGFATETATVLATVTAYREDRNASERWANRAVFKEADSLFRFRKIPGLRMTAEMTIMCAGEKYRILSAEDVRSRGMYVEVLAGRLEPSVR